MAKAKKKPVCDVCKDTHQMVRTKDCGDQYEVMCASCPVPCQECRQGGNGPYCETTPCACACHARDWRYPETVATATTATFGETSDGVTSYPLPPCPECGGAIVMPPARCVGRCASSAGLDVPALPAAVTELLNAAKDLVASDGFERLDGTRQTYDGGRYCDAHDRLTAALEKLEVSDAR